MPVSRVSETRLEEKVRRINVKNYLSSLSSERRDRNCGERAERMWGLSEFRIWLFLKMWKCGNVEMWEERKFWSWTIPMDMFSPPGGQKDVEIVI